MKGRLYRFNFILHPSSFRYDAWALGERVSPLVCVREAEDC
jgi:hypothetical protein